MTPEALEFFPSKPSPPQSGVADEDAIPLHPIEDDIVGPPIFQDQMCQAGKLLASEIQELAGGSAGAEPKRLCRSSQTEQAGSSKVSAGPIPDFRQRGLSAPEAQNGEECGRTTIRSIVLSGEGGA